MSYSSCCSIEVPFFDVDSMNVVWHGHYVKYLELARCKLLDELGFGYQDMAANGLMFPIIDMNLRYVGALSFGQKIDVVATLSEWEYRLKIDYVISDCASKKVLTKAYTIQAAINAETKELLLGCPKVLVDQINRVLQAT